MSPNTRQTNIPGLDIPTHDTIEPTWHGATNNLDTVLYKLGGAGGTLVATLTFTYAVHPPLANDANILRVVRS